MSPFFYISETASRSSVNTVVQAHFVDNFKSSGGKLKFYSLRKQSLVYNLTN